MDENEVDEFERIVNDSSEECWRTPHKANMLAGLSGMVYADEQWPELRAAGRLPSIQDLAAVARSRDLDSENFTLGFATRAGVNVESVPGTKGADLGAAIESMRKAVERDYISEGAGKHFIERGWNVGWPKCFRKVLPQHELLLAIAKERGLDAKGFVRGAASGVRWMRHRDKLSGLDNDPA